MDGIWLVLTLTFLVLAAFLIHQDGKRIGHERGRNEAEARRRHPSAQARNVRVIDPERHYR